ICAATPHDLPIPTWEILRTFHSRHNPPSNARFYTYGDQPLEVTLEAIERGALSRFQRIDVDGGIPDVTRFTKPRQAVEAYPAEPGEELERKAQALTAWVTVPSGDSFRTLA